MYTNDLCVTRVVLFRRHGVEGVAPCLPQIARLVTRTITFPNLQVISSRDIMYHTVSILIGEIQRALRGKHTLSWNDQHKFLWCFPPPKGFWFQGSDVCSVSKPVPGTRARGLACHMFFPPEVIWGFKYHWEQEDTYLVKTCCLCAVIRKLFWILIHQCRMTTIVNFLCDIAAWRRKPPQKRHLFRMWWRLEPATSTVCQIDRSRISSKVS